MDDDHLRSLLADLRSGLEGAHRRINELIEGVTAARKDAEQARGRVAMLEERLYLLTERLRQEGVALGSQALGLLSQGLPPPIPPGPPTPARRRAASADGAGEPRSPAPGKRRRPPGKGSRRDAA